MTGAIRALLVAALIAVGACAQPEDPAELGPADQAKAKSMLESYEAARSGKNWEAAEGHADRLRQRYPDSAAAATMSATVADVRTHALEARDQRRVAALWEYQAVAAAGGVQRSAAIYSRTVPVDEGEIAPVADARLVLRDHPEWGRSAYLLLAQSRFRCSSPCRMDISFDGGEARSWSGKQADSGHGPALFINDDSGFIESMSKSSLVRIKLPGGSGAVSSLTFEVGGFQASRYRNPGATLPR